ncbi:MAG: hypothetical protein VCD33_13105 [Alphaproteobacteria bacterium]
MWLGDLGAWAATIGHALKPGGVFYMADVHPLLQAFDDEAESGDQPPPITYGYFSGSEPTGFDTANDYADENAVLRTTQTYEWFHSLGKIITSLSAVGLRIEFLHEHKILAWRGVKGLVKQDEHFYGLPDSRPRIPLSFSLRAVKEG